MTKQNLEEISKLVEKTTIVQVKNRKGEVVLGDEYITSRYSSIREEQIDLTSLRENWEVKWLSFGDKWSEERQLYRFLFDTFQIFYYSFKQLRNNKAATIPMGPYDPQLDILLKFSNANLFGMYNYGKKCIDLVDKLGVIDILSSDQKKYLNKMKETRNKIFEHNYNPSGFNITISPSAWSIASTNSICDISIHGKKEEEFTAKIDYYDDYYNVESILAYIIRNFE